jgi:type IV secretion system protein VirD4
MKLRCNSSTFNPVDFISKDSPTALELCNSLSNALVVRTGEEKEPHFNDCAQEGIAGLTALIVYYGRPGKRSLQEVDQIVTSREKLDTAMKLMCGPDDTDCLPWGGMLARAGGRMQLWQGDERGSVLSTMARHLQFLRTPAIAANTAATNFDPSKLVRGKMAVFIVPSLQFGQTLIPWVRMVIDGLLKAVIRCGLQEKRKTHWIIDEAASLGPMDALRDVLDKGAGYGMRCQFYYQSAGQLNRCWPKGEAASFLAQTARVYFGVNDLETATQISNSIGKATIVVESGNWNRGGSRSASQGHGYNESRGTSWNETRSWSQSPREIFKPEEITTLPPRTAISFPGGGMAPVVTTLLRWFEEPWLTKKRGWLSRQWAAAIILFRSVVFAILMICVAGLVTEIAFGKKVFDQFVQSQTKGGKR